MPSQQYFLELDDPTICELDMDMSHVTAKEFGFTEIVLKDRSILKLMLYLCYLVLGQHFPARCFVYGMISVIIIIDL